MSVETMAKQKRPTALPDECTELVLEDVLRMPQELLESLGYRSSDGTWLLQRKAFRQADRRAYDVICREDDASTLVTLGQAAFDAAKEDLAEARAAEERQRTEQDEDENA